jgi:hypothetical protein
MRQPRENLIIFGFTERLFPFFSGNPDAESEKRTSSAKAILADLRSGMSGFDIKAKYGLSDRAFEKGYAKMDEAGLFDESRKAKSLTTQTRNRLKGTFVKSCPACRAELPPGEDEYRICGFVQNKHVIYKFIGRCFDLLGIQTEAGSWSLVILSDLIFFVLGVSFIGWTTERGSPKAKLALQLQIRLKTMTSFQIPSDPASVYTPFSFRILYTSAFGFDPTKEVTTSPLRTKNTAGMLLIPKAFTSLPSLTMTRPIMTLSFVSPATSVRVDAIHLHGIQVLL